MVKNNYQVGDLIIVSTMETSGVPMGSVGIVTKVELVTKKHYIYWVSIGSLDQILPLWEEEFEILDGSR